MRSFGSGTSVILSAPESIFDGIGLLSFDHWELDAMVQEPCLTTIEVKLTEDHFAVAVYSRAPWQE